MGTRPNFIKIAPLLRAFAAGNRPIQAALVHTGQHYDAGMNDAFFQQLGIPPPDINLEVGSGSHAAQTAAVMRRFEPVLEREAPDAVLVVGDVNSTLACSLVAAKNGIKVVHVEAGLRSGDRDMPEEVNRVVTDQLADRLYITERQALGNLVAEGVAPERVVFVGNVMIDALQGNLERAVPVTEFLGALPATVRWSEPARSEAAVPPASLTQATVLAAASVSAASARAPAVAPATRAARSEARKLHPCLAGPSPRYALLTLHRPSNVDDARVLRGLLETFYELGQQLPILFPMHPRTRGKIEAANLQHLIDQERLIALPPVGYLEMLGLMRSAQLVLTDSGGMQEETTALGVPCLTLRDNTERPITIDQGTNLLVGNSPDRIREHVLQIIRSGGKRGRIPEYWDGHAAQRIAQDLHQWLM